MPCCTLAYAQDPVLDVHEDATPALEYTAYERAAREGTIRNPQPNTVNAPGTPEVDPPDASILQRVLGVFKPAKHPVPTLFILRPWDGSGSDPGDGGHEEVAPGAAIPPQGQEGLGTYRTNTWRARPQPWDAANYVGAAG